MKHKRKGPKSTRAGCLLCKPHKRQGLRRLVKVKGVTGRLDLRRSDGSTDAHDSGRDATHLRQE